MSYLLLEKSRKLTIWKVVKSGVQIPSASVSAVQENYATCATLPIISQGLAQCRFIFLDPKPVRVK